MLMYFNVIVGFMFLLGGAEVLVRGAVGLAERLGVSKLVIGMTVIAFGTSMPELIVSLNASLSGSSGLAIGNLVGSNIANILLILGATGLIMPITSNAKSLRPDSWLLAAGTLVFVVMTVDEIIGLFEGLILIILFSGFLYFTYLREVNTGNQNGTGHYQSEVEELKAVPKAIWSTCVLVVLGLACLIGGSELLVDGGVAIARKFGVSETVIGLTIIAFGTSLPELAASIVAAIRKHTDLALGNVLGSNIFNIIGIVGIVAVVRPFQVPSRVTNFDMWVMISTTLIFLFCVVVGRNTVIPRLVAGAFIMVYLAYVVIIANGVNSFSLN